MPDAAGSNTSLAQWWLRFDDPLLGELVAQTLQANTSVKSAEGALRLALEREVLLQFLIEAVALAALGGLTGIVIATAACYVLAGLMSVPYLFDPGINLLSFAFAAGIGVAFGYFPARLAAQLDSIEALRHE